MENSSSVRLGQDFKDFIRKLKANRIKAGTDDDILSSRKIADIIVRYFKENNQEYLRVVSMEDACLTN